MLTRREFIKNTSMGVAVLTLPCAMAHAASKTQTDALLSYDAMGLAELVRTRQVSPREVVEATIRRIEALDSKINAMVTRTFERGLKAAEKVDPKAPLAGVPFLLKDNIDVAGVKSTHGSAFYKNHIAKVSAPMVQIHEAAGLIILGKTNMPEVGLAPTTEPLLLGACHNPWDLQYSSGGSSGGSAAAVAAGYLPVAHASDGGGSIRIPASCCGIFGLKPSRLRMVAGSTNQADFAVDHCVSRSVRDSALLFSLTQDRSSNAPFKPVEFVSGPGRQRLKIGLCMQNHFGKLPHPDVQHAIEAAAKLCEDLGHTVVQVENPISGEAFERHFMALFSTRISALAAQVAEQTGKPAAQSGMLEPFTLGFDEKGRALGSDAVEKAGKYFGNAGITYAQWMQAFDMVLTPVLPTPPAQLGYLSDTAVGYETLSRRVFDYMAYTPIQNALGLPAMSVPLGMSAKGLPIGSHFVAKPGDEKTLFELAYELEQAQPWANKWASISAKAQNI